MARKRARRAGGKKYCVKKGKKTVKCYRSKHKARAHANRIGARCSSVKPSRSRRTRSRRRSRR